MLAERVIDVVNLWLFHISPADGASLNLRYLVVDDTSKTVFLLFALHEPVSVDADQMESMETGFNPDQVTSICKPLILIVSVLTELFQAHSAPSFYCVVITGQNLSYLLMQFI